MDENKEFNEQNRDEYNVIPHKHSGCWLKFALLFDCTVYSLLSCRILCTGSNAPRILYACNAGREHRQNPAGARQNV